jgi:hypothetical protein
VRGTERSGGQARGEQCREQGDEQKIAVSAHEDESTRLADGAAGVKRSGSKPRCGGGEEEFAPCDFDPLLMPDS